MSQAQDSKMTPEIDFTYQLVRRFIDNYGSPTSEGFEIIAGLMTAMAENDYSYLLRQAKDIYNIVGIAIKQMEDMENGI